MRSSPLTQSSSHAIVFVYMYFYVLFNTHDISIDRHTMQYSDLDRDDRSL